MVAQTCSVGAPALTVSRGLGTQSRRRADFTFVNENGGPRSAGSRCSTRRFPSSRTSSSRLSVQTLRQLDSPVIAPRSSAPRRIRGRERAAKLRI